MNATRLEIVKYLKLLAETPRRLEKIARDFDEARLRFKPDKNSWSRAAIIKGCEHTVFTQVRRVATHESVHCEQIESLLW